MSEKQYSGESKLAYSGHFRFFQWTNIKSASKININHRQKFEFYANFGILIVKKNAKIVKKSVYLFGQIKKIVLPLQLDLQKDIISLQIVTIIYFL
ncbi:MAG: hypothetical protein ACI30S_05290 [Muribaculaceae bacterium]